MIIKNIFNFTKKEILCLLNQKYERMCTMSITANIMSVIQENKEKRNTTWIGNSRKKCKQQKGEMKNDILVHNESSDLYKLSATLHLVLKISIHVTKIRCILTKNEL